MPELTFEEVLRDLKSIDQSLRQFEEKFGLSSAVFYELYTRGQLDTGDHLEDFAEWAGLYELKLNREELLHQYSAKRVDSLKKKRDHNALIDIPVQSERAA